MMAQSYNFSVKPQSKNQPFSRFFLKTADFSIHYDITNLVAARYSPRRESSRTMVRFHHLSRLGT
jgi:hypothetical protein